MASDCATWRWLFWKGIVDEPSGLGAGRESSRRPTCKALSEAELEQLAAEMRCRADRRGRPPLGALRQQPRRRRALPGAAPDLRLHAGPADLGHRPSDLSPQADHRPRRPVAHDPDQGGPDGLPQPRRKPIRPVHDRARRLCPIDGPGAQGRRRDGRCLRAACGGRHRRRRIALRASSSRRSTTPAD